MFMNILEYENYQETKKHSDAFFPYITYPCTIPLDFKDVPLHWHEEMEIIYIKKGQGLITVNLTQYHLKAGAIIFVLPGQLHAIDQFENETMEYENIIFDTNMLISKQLDSSCKDFILPLLDGRIAIPPVFLPEDIHYKDICAPLDACDKISDERPEGYLLFIKGQIFQLFFVLNLYCKLSESTQPDAKMLNKIKPVLKYVELHYAQNITIKDAAAVAQCSESHFMRCFKEILGISFIEYLKDYRLSMAARLLTGSDTTVLATAADVGFDNLSYFNRCFKEKYGTTPGKFRQRSHDI